MNTCHTCVGYVKVGATTGYPVVIDKSLGRELRGRLTRGIRMA
jgi:hypothetical protein